MRVCMDYDQAHTHYSLRDAKKWKAHCAKATDDPTTKKPSRPHFSIYWLRLFISLEIADYCVLCTQVSKPEGDRAQQRTSLVDLKTRNRPFELLLIRLRG